MHTSRVFDAVHMAHAIQLACLAYFTVASPSRHRAHAGASDDARHPPRRESDMRLGLKILMVLGLTLAILVPLTMIRGTINERQMYRAQAVQTVARSYAGAQGVAGPVLVVPYVETIECTGRTCRTRESH